MRIPILALSCAALLFAACSAGDGNDSPDPARADNTPVATATVTQPSSTPNAETASNGSAAATVPTRYVGNTGGAGVAVRDACAQTARSGGAWPEATEVLVLEVGVENCDGWSYVAREGSLSESWVRNSYLMTQRPVLVVARPPTSTPTNPPSSTSTPPTPIPTQPAGPIITLPQISVSPNPLNFGEIPPNQISVRSMLLTNTSQDPVTITSVVFDNGSNFSGAFEVSPNCDGQVVAPHVACRIVVRFTPTSGGSHMATLRISSSTATAPLTALVLGVGFIPE